MDVSLTKQLKYSWTLKTGFGVETGAVGRWIVHMTFYWSAIVNIALSCTVFELVDVE